MSLTTYKAIFDGNEEDVLTLTFKEFYPTNSLNIDQKYISNLKNLSQTTPHIISFQNIREVIKVGANSNTFAVNYYNIILFITKKDNCKMGFLIGNLKKKGNILLGIWPFTQELNTLTRDDIEKILNNLISKPQNFSKICLIYS